jgi:rhamnosyltransferase
MIEETHPTLLLPAVIGIEQVCVIIPTFNASRHWPGLHDALKSQGLQRHQVLVIDSSSTDNTRDLVEEAGYRVMRIPKRSFRHGATRQMAAEVMSSAEVMVYMTQDARLFGSNPIESLLRAFDDPQVGAAYGRQLPRPDAGPIERHARLFSYADRSEIRTLASREHMGFRVAFFSDSFAAYRRTAFDHVGGFPTDTIASEEVTVAARMLLYGWKIAYRADAAVIHSHNLTIASEFSRYFDIGVHHGRSRWLLDEFGGAGGEGRKFVVSQMRYLMDTEPSKIPLAVLRNISKWCSYKLGVHESLLPIFVKRTLSAQPDFWLDEEPDAHPSAQSHEATRVQP